MIARVACTSTHTRAERWETMENAMIWEVVYRSNGQWPAIFERSKRADSHQWKFAMASSVASFIVWNPWNELIFDVIILFLWPFVMVITWTTQHFASDTQRHWFCFNWSVYFVNSRCFSLIRTPKMSQPPTPANQSPVVASLPNRSPHPYSSIAMSPSRQYAIIAGKDSLQLVKITPTGLVSCKTIQISQVRL